MAIDGLGNPSRTGTAILACLAAALLVLGGWWWTANEPPVDQVAVDAAGQAEHPPTEPDRSVTVRVDSDGRPVLTTKSGRRQDLRADAWQLLPERPNTIASTAKVVTELRAISLDVSGVDGERYRIEWFCLGTGEMRMGRGRDGEPETVDCVPSPTALLATPPVDGELRVSFQWTGSVAALIGVQVSIP